MPHSYCEYIVHTSIWSVLFLIDFSMIVAGRELMSWNAGAILRCERRLF